MFNLGNGVDYEHPDRSKFAINAFTGELFLIAPVDRDPPHGRDLWRLNITAETEDGRRVNGSVTVLVRVRDINDNAPTFEAEVYRANVSENNAAGIDIIRLVAVDHDSDSIVRYSIEMNRVNSEGELIFDIDELSGVLSTAVCCLDRESIDQFTIKVCAIDSAIGGDANSFHWSKASQKQDKSSAHYQEQHQQQSSMSGGNQSCTSVIIDITDENDERPMFTRDKYFLLLSDGIDELYPGRTLVNSTVIDGDKPETNRFACQVSGSLRFPFQSTTTAVNIKNETNNKQNSLEVANNFSLPLTSALLKFFVCHISSNGNVRLSLDDHHFSRPQFYRLLTNEYDTYNNNVLHILFGNNAGGTANSKGKTLSLSDLPDHVNLQLRLTVSDIAIFEHDKLQQQQHQSTSTLIDMPVVLDQHLTTAEVLIRLATKYKNFETDQAQLISDGENNEQLPSLTVVTKQISSYKYNSNTDPAELYPFALLNQFLPRSLRVTQPRQQIMFVVVSLSILFSFILFLFLFVKYRQRKLQCFARVWGTQARPRSDASVVYYTPCPSAKTISEGTLRSLDQSTSPGEAIDEVVMPPTYTENESSKLDTLRRFKAYGPLTDTNCPSSTVTDLSYNSSNMTQQRFSPLEPPTATAIASNNSLMGSNAHLVLIDPSENASSSNATYSFEMNEAYDIALYDLTQFQLSQPSTASTKINRNDTELVDFYKHHQQHHHNHLTANFPSANTTNPLVVRSTGSKQVAETSMTHFKLLPDVIHSSGYGLVPRSDASTDSTSSTTGAFNETGNVLFFGDHRVG